MNTQIQQYNQVNEKLDLIKKTVAVNATDTELELFMHVANKYKLDPLNKEIWFIKFNDKSAPTMMTSRDGYLKIAHDSGKLNGMESYTVDNEQGDPIKAVCIVYRKDMSHPFRAEIKVKEYHKDNKIWNTYTSAMAIKVAEVFALKRAFTISGLLTSEEIGEKEEQKEDISEIFEEDSKKITEAQRKRLFAIAKKNGWENEDVKELLFSHFSIKSSKEIPAEIYENVISLLEKGDVENG